MGTSTVNIWLVLGLIGNALFTNVIMIFLKRQFSDWDKKAWAPPLIGAVGGVFGAMASGQITSVDTLILWILTGVGAGSFASSARDTVKGK